MIRMGDLMGWRIGGFLGATLLFIAGLLGACDHRAEEKPDVVPPPTEDKPDILTVRARFTC